MIREINDGDRTGYLTYTDANGYKQVGEAIHVGKTLQLIGECKFIEIDDDTRKVLSLRKELPKKKKTNTKKDK